jgi:hypothetical protein
VRVSFAVVTKLPARFKFDPSVTVNAPANTNTTKDPDRFVAVMEVIFVVPVMVKILPYRGRVIVAVDATDLLTGPLRYLYISWYQVFHSTNSSLLYGGGGKLNIICNKQYTPPRS